MELKYVVPNMEKTFGHMEFGSALELGRGDTQRINQQVTVKQRRYKLFSRIQSADDIEVIIPGKAAEKQFDFMEPVKLVNPKIKVEGYVVGGRGFTDYILYADDIIKA